MTFFDDFRVFTRMRRMWEVELLVHMLFDFRCHGNLKIAQKRQIATLTAPSTSLFIINSQLIFSV